MIERAKAFAPASVANVCIGFDILGHAVQGIGDYVTALRSEEPGVRVRSITGMAQEVPLEAKHNTAGRAVMALLEEQGIKTGVELEIEKGIPLSSGMGGSAASAVAAVFAANALMPEPAPRLAVLRYALVGVQCSSA